MVKIEECLWLDIEDYVLGPDGKIYYYGARKLIHVVDVRDWFAVDEALFYALEDVAW